ncbi:duf1680 domain containing protein [Grosmannia clavigera kw1407]|uniref:Duf1680 domain containing protein n=1 Tax=Grosmannia clavigera (strain kw1407 / UAMH 11150) TaxID=655863 RepID=F0X9V3_GROCL|nr:duf1680 domain containing protein [Grosmannia clavigera kw1407]EFX06033.1 duf1680 domain containing protein [Grosmannia clavigera kw1407]
MRRPISSNLSGFTDTGPIENVCLLASALSLKPRGWIRDQLQLEADGLAGRMLDFYRFVNDSQWLGGSSEYSVLNEASPYWFNGLVPLAFSLEDDDGNTAAARIRTQVRQYLDYVLDHQQPDGWLGFETTHQTRGLWARCLLLLGLMQYADADPAQTDRIVEAMHRYVVLAHSMLQDNYTGLIVHDDDVFDTAGFGVARTHEMHIPLQWLYEQHSHDHQQQQRLWETMELMVAGGELWGADWRQFWVETAFPAVLDNDSPYNLSWVFTHGVNMAQGLRYPLSIYRMTGDEALKEQTRTALNLLSRYHRSLAGSIVADEIITNLNPSHGAELCTAAEMMFSTAWIYQQMGDNDVADWAEQAAFNALPASISPDWWSHQYVQQENQPWARNLTEGAGLWTDVNTYGNVFGLEPDYPCCTVNHPQAYPKFLANAFVRTQDGGLAHVFLVAALVNTTLDDGTHVSVRVDTHYPFALDLTYTVTASAPFFLYVRIPTWADASKSTVRIQHRRWGTDGHKTETIQSLFSPYPGLHRLSVPGGSGTAVFTVELATQLRIVRRANHTAALYYGPLLYSLAIDHTTTSGPPRHYRHADQLLPGSTVHDHTHDHVLEPTSSWSIAIDPSQVRVIQHPVAGDLANPVWTLGAPPVELCVAAVEIEWPLEYDSPAAPPTIPEPVAGAVPFSARFVPYGSAKLHMADFPVMVLPKIELK